MILMQEFYNQPTLKVAKELLGKKLVRQVNNKLLVGRITETEAYIGQSDKACHASKGKTFRNNVMFEGAGFWYVYLIYGMYYCLNVVTEEPDFPAAVLIRGLEPEKGIVQMRKNRDKEKLKDLTSGPGKLCQALGVDKKFNQTKAFDKKSGLWIENGICFDKSQIKADKRVGVEYAGSYWANKKWRFYVKNLS